MLLDEMRQQSDAMIATLSASIDREGVAGFFSDANTIKRHLRLTDHDVDELVQQSITLCEQKEWELAADALAYIILLEPFQPAHYLRLGAALMQVGKMDDARNALELGVNLNPDEPRSYLYIGNCYLVTQQLKEAGDAFQKCLDTCKRLFGSNSDVIALAKEALVQIKYCG